VIEKSGVDPGKIIISDKASMEIQFKVSLVGYSQYLREKEWRKSRPYVKEVKTHARYIIVL
jgi:hypothetical protein